MDFDALKQLRKLNWKEQVKSDAKLIDSVILFVDKRNDQRAKIHQSAPGNNKGKKLGVESDKAIHGSKDSKPTSKNASNAKQAGEVGGKRKRERALQLKAALQRKTRNQGHQITPHLREGNWIERASTNMALFKVRKMSHQSCKLPFIF